MLYLNSWQRDLDKKSSIIIISLIIALFLLFECALFSKLLSQRYFDKGLEILMRARLVPSDVIVEKSLLYQDGLKLLKRAIELNPYDSRSYFEYAEVLAEIANDNLLKSSLDIENIASKQEGDSAFYNLIRLKYIEAIAKEPTNAIYHLRLADIYNKLSDYIKAEDEYRKAVLLDSQNAMVHLYLAQYFLSKNKELDFLYHLDRIIKLYKFMNYGPLRSKIEDFFKAIGRGDLIRR